MPQIFHRSTNVLSKLSIFGGVFFAGGLLALLAAFDRSSYNTGAYVALEQPVQFSHKHHVGDDGIDCRYCHTSVETTAFAGIPPTKTCMNCHSQLFSDSPYLEPVFESWRSGRPIRWQRVHDLPDFVYFNHSIHVNKGVGCVECHGRMDRMPQTHQVASLQMEWCLDCHRNPTRVLRPAERIFDMAWQPPADQAVQGALLAREYETPDVRVLTSCSTCHR
jgi:hypothetical protein